MGLHFGKSQKRVIVPFEGYIAPAKDILERIGYSVPKISNQKFNEYIKTVGKLAGMDEIIKITRYSGKQKLVIEKGSTTSYRAMSAEDQW